MNKFTLPITPPTVTSQGGGKRMVIDKKTNRPMFFKSDGAKAAAADYETLLAFHKPRKPVSGPVELSVLFVFPYKADEPKKNRIKGLIWKKTKPDTDNMVKLLKDSMTAVRFWEDDGQVCAETVRKCFGEPPRIEVSWRELPSIFFDQNQSPVIFTDRRLPVRFKGVRQCADHLTPRRQEGARSQTEPSWSSSTERVLAR